MIEMQFVVASLLFCNWIKVSKGIKEIERHNI